MTPEALDAVLNQSVVANLRKLEAASGTALLPQLLASFSAVTPPKLAALRAAIAASDTQAVQYGAHTLKGSSANLGAQQMTQLCADLEICGQTRDLACAVSLLAQIEGEFARACIALEQEILKG